MSVTIQDDLRMYISYKCTAMVKMSKYSYLCDFLALFWRDYDHSVANLCCVVNTHTNLTIRLGLAANESQES